MPLNTSSICHPAPIVAVAPTRWLPCMPPVAVPGQPGARWQQGVSPATACRQLQAGRAGWGWQAGGGGWRVSPWRWHRQYCNQATRKEDDLSLCNPQHRQFTGLSTTSQCTVTGSYSSASEVWLARSPYSCLSSCVCVWSPGGSLQQQQLTPSGKGKRCQQA